MSDWEDSWSVSWNAINARAWMHLRQKYDALGSGSGDGSLRSPSILIWRDAMSFGDERDPGSLLVCESYAGADSEETVVRVRQSVWKRDADLSSLQQKCKEIGKASAPTPTIETREGLVPAGEYSDFVAESTLLAVPVYTPSSDPCVTLDVGSTGIEFYSDDSPSAVVSIQWSMDTPESWRPIIDFTDRLQDFLEGCL